MASQLWQNAPRHDGLVVCGAPLGEANDGSPGDLFDEMQRNAIPIGSTAFVQAFLEDWRSKLDYLGRRVEAMAVNATSTLPWAQVANLLVRH